ncbi:MAG: hypothetical protein Q3979_05515 [Actinomycetaceae bacterium]|nr:hypothetical protein [Actinomycetaceae bacterium]
MRAGLWVEIDGGYLFNDWSDYQPTAKEIAEKRASARQRKAKERAKKARESSAKRPQNVTRDVTPHVTRDNPEHVTPLPTRPIYTSREVTNVPSLDGGVGEGNNATASPEPAKPDGADAPAATAAHQAPKAKPAKRATPLPDDWTPNPTHAHIAAENGANVALEAAKYRDWLTATGRTYRDHDAAFRNWLRRATPTPSPAPTTTAPHDELAAARKARRQRNEPKPDAVPPTREFLDLKAKLTHREGVS